VGTGVWDRRLERTDSERSAGLRVGQGLAGDASPSLRAQRSNPECILRLDCFAALAMTKGVSDRQTSPRPPSRGLAFSLGAREGCLTPSHARDDGVGIGTVLAATAARSGIMGSKMGFFQAHLAAHRSSKRTARTQNDRRNRIQNFLNLATASQVCPSLNSHSRVLKTRFSLNLLNSG
jgi:hypothetical protein